MMSDPQTGRQPRRRFAFAILTATIPPPADMSSDTVNSVRPGLIVTDGCPGLAAPIQTVYPRVAHQRCWVHQMRNILEHVRQRDYEPPFCTNSLTSPPATFRLTIAGKSAMLVA